MYFLDKFCRRLRLPRLRDTRKLVLKYRHYGPDSTDICIAALLAHFNEKLARKAA